MVVEAVDLAAGAHQPAKRVPHRAAVVALPLLLLLLMLMLLLVIVRGPRGVFGEDEGELQHIALRRLQLLPNPLILLEDVDVR